MAEAGGSAMDDECWKSTAVVDRDVMEEPEERLEYIHFEEGIPLGERLLTAAEKGCTALVLEILTQNTREEVTQNNREEVKQTNREEVTQTNSSTDDVTTSSAADIMSPDAVKMTTADARSGDDVPPTANLMGCDDVPPPANLMGCDAVPPTANLMGCDAVPPPANLMGCEVVNYQDSDGYTALHRACYQGWSDIVEIIIRHGGDVSSRTEDGWTPLHSAARWNKVECAKLLIAAGCDVNALSNGRQTPLHIACSSQACSEVIQLLLWNPDTDVTIVNGGGETAEKLALSNSRLGPLFEMRHKFVDINPLLGKDVFYQ